MSETKQVDGTAAGQQQKSSKDILNELFSSFNASFDDDVEDAEEEKSSSSRSKKKKKSSSKKSKKSSRNKDRAEEEDTADAGASSGDDDHHEDDKSSSPSKKHKGHRHHHHHQKNGSSTSSSKKESSSSIFISSSSSKSTSLSKSKRRSSRHNNNEEQDDEEDVDELIAKHRKSVKKNAGSSSKYNKVVKDGLIPPSSIGDIVINNDELLKSKKRKREEELRKLAGELPPAPPVPVDVEDGEILEFDEGNNDNDDDFSKKLHKRDKSSKKKHSSSSKLSASQAYKLDIEEKLLLGLEPFVRTVSSSVSASRDIDRHLTRKGHREKESSSSHHHHKSHVSSKSDAYVADALESRKSRHRSDEGRGSVRKDEHVHADKEHRRSSSSHNSHSSLKRSSSLKGDELEESVRHAPPRDPTPPPIPSPPAIRDDPPPSSSSSRRSYSYKDTGWEKEKDHYSQSSSSSSNSHYDSNYSSSSSRSRRESYYNSRNYDVDGYYDREASRRSDGKSGFGFLSRSYYDDPVQEHGRDRGSSSRSHNHDDRYSSSSSDRDRYDSDRRRNSSPRRSSRSSRRSRSRSRSPLRWRRSRSRSKERYRHPDDIIDKAKLLEIARKNAAKLLKRGVLPSDIFSRDQIVAIRAGGKSVDELTNYCQKLARKDARGDAISDESGGSDGEEHFVHHPFQVKDRPMPQITMNIRNSIPIPVRTPQELAIESAKLKVVFPVSSGTQHRIKELEWHPVDKDEEEKKAKAAEEANKSLVPLDVPKPAAEEEPKTTQGGEINIVETTQAPVETVTSNSKELLAITEGPKKPQTDIRNETPKPPDFDISDVIAIRLKAMRHLSENPNSFEAKQQLEDATQMMKRWADAKALEPKFLTQSELTQGPQAWAKRDQLTSAKEVQSPMGLHLLQKMGWKPGEGLGKNKGGDVEPLALEVKTDKKGLTSVLDYKKGPALPLVFDLSGKHPISALMELSAKRKWGGPEFDLVFEHGPPHKKQFVYKVIVNGVEYQPCVAVNNKKLAKANAAAFCLQSLGLLPTAKPPEADTMLQTVDHPPAPVPPPASLTAPPPPPPSTSGGPNTFQQRFTQSHYLQTVPTATINPQPPLPLMSAEALMPPPPPPPPLKRF